MPAICRTPVRGSRMRLTRLDECGMWVNGECSTLVAEGFVSVAMTDNVTEAEAITRVDSAGNQFVNEQGHPTLNYIQVTVTFRGIDPQAVEMTTGAPLILDAAGNAIGNDDQSDTYGRANWALEVWTGLSTSGQACGTSGQEHGYFLLPWLSGATIGDLTIANDAVDFSVVARTQEGTPWGAGPYPVVLDSGGNPAPPPPTEVTAHRRRLITSLAPPAGACGCVPLDVSP